MSKKLARAQHTKIARDWLALAPCLGKLNNVSLLKINGPILCGFYFKPSAGRDGYIPVGHIHNLCSGFDTLTLDVGNSGKMLRQSEHDALKYQNEFDQIRSALPLVATEEVYAESVFSAYFGYFRQRKFRDVEGYLTPLQHMIRLAIWCGFDTLASNFCAVVNGRVEALPSDRGNSPGVLRWHDFCALDLTRERLENVVESSIREIGVEGLPRYEFIVGTEPTDDPMGIVP